MPKKSTASLNTLRHSTAHVVAAAVQELYPGTKFGIGPTIENGFYYDFDFPREISEKDLVKIEKKAREIIKRKEAFTKKELSINEATKLFKDLKQGYKVELLKDLKDEGEKKVSIYKVGKFTDLCRGPHVKNAGELKIFKLTKIAGAYWRGDEKNKMLTRIYGTAFNTKEKLISYLKMIKEAEKRDHRKLGKELDLFVFSDLVGKGLPLLTPKGSIVRQELERFIVDEETKRGYLRVYTPDLAKVELYKKSGHWNHYKESMYPPIKVDGEEFVLRPMACPHHFMIFNSRPRSYRELPLRYGEIAKLYRKEQSGELSGLIRLMSFSLVDAHIICTPDQIEKEFEQVVDLVQYGMKVLGIKDYWYRFSKGNPKNKKKYIDNPDAWKKSQASMKKILNKIKLKYVEAEDEAAFYGPKLDVQMRNVNGKEDTAFTIQIDFAMPEKFDLTYVDKDGKEKRPMIIHRASIGCIERTMSFLIEQYAGAFPVWLSPTQVQIIPVGEKHNTAAQKLAKIIKEENIRVFVDILGETVGNKIRKAEKEKVPYMIVVGDKEIPKGGKWTKAKMLNIRVRGKKDIERMTFGKFVKRIKDEVERKS